MRARPPALQSFVQQARRAVPRGWAPVLKALAHVNPSLQRYRARMSDGEDLFVDLRQSMCLGYFFAGGLPHESGTETLLKAVLGPGSVFVDVGANIGYFSRIGSRLVGQHGRVFAYEPAPLALDLLRQNLSELANVSIRAAAVGAEAGEAEFFVRPLGDTSSLECDSARGVRKIRVPVVTLDSELRELSRLDLIKIDVEGYEREVLEGCRSLIARLRPVLYFEVIPEYLQRRQQRLEDFAGLLRDHGYQMAWINHAAQSIAELCGQTQSTYALGLPDNDCLARSSAAS